MADRTAIQWTDATWNPVRGCTKISPGCAHCYAETFAERFRGVKGHPYEQGFDLRLVPEKIEEPLRWKKPRRVFVNSMSDLFQDGVPDEYIDRVFSVMALAERHTFQVLTKRPERMRAWFAARRFDVKGYAILQTESGECHYAFPWPLPNVWLGVSVENQHFADERIPLLLHTPAAVRFISAEPLLEGLDLAKHRPGALGLHWCIVGGESGPGARPCETWWIRNIVGQCRYADVAVFVKQLGANPQQRVMYSAPTFEPDQLIHVEPLKLRDRKGGDIDEWPLDLRVREFPTERTDSRKG
jgi:protein gp37